MKKSKYDPYYRIAFHPRHVTVIPRPYSKASRRLNLHAHLSSGGLIKQHKGKVSPNAKRKIRTAIEWLLASADTKYLYSKKTGKFHEWKISFCTLTLPKQGEFTDKQIKEILNAWLTQAKYSFGLKSYIWKAEPQARGDIHFHITSDCFMWHTKVRHSWNRLLHKYNLLNGHSNPNSTDIHSTYKVKNLAAYLCKYFTKEGDTRRGIDGRLWGCSRTLSNARGIRFEMDWNETKGECYALQNEAEYFMESKWCNNFYMKENYLLKYPKCKLTDLYRAKRKLIRKRKVHDQFEVWDTTGALITDQRIISRIKK